MQKKTKKIDAHATITLRFPVSFNVDAEMVEYEDDNGKPYYEEEYKYDVDDALKQNEVVNSFVEQYKNNIEEIIID